MQTLSASTTAASDCAGISVIICAFSEERWGDLIEAVDSIRHQTVAALETIVVIDHNDRLLARVREALPDVIALANRGERGAGGARNTGVERARGPVVAFLDDDARAVPQWTERITASLDDTSLLGVGGEVEARWLHQEPRWFPREFRWVVGCSYTGQPTSPAPVRNLMAGNMAVRRQVFISLGGYRQGHGNVQSGPTAPPQARRRFVTRQSGCEETEFCLRATERWAHRTWLYQPDVAISHNVPRARTTVRYFLARCNDEGLAKASVVVKYAGSKRGLAAERRYVTRVLPRAVLVGISQGLRGDLWGFARSLAVIAGLSVTMVGYGRARAATRLTRDATDDARTPGSTSG